MKVGRLGGGGSDYAAFVQHIGVPSADLTFGGGKTPRTLGNACEPASLFNIFMHLILQAWTVNQCQSNEKSTLY